MEKPEVKTLFGGDNSDESKSSGGARATGVYQVKPDKKRRKRRKKAVPEATCGRGSKKVAISKLIEAAGKANGIYSLLGAMLGVEYRTAIRYLEKVPEAKQAFEDSGKKTLDAAESKLYSIMNNPEHPRQFDAIVFMLKTKGKSRGWTERTETEVSGTLSAEVSAASPPVFRFVGKDGKDCDVELLKEMLRDGTPEANR